MATIAQTALIQMVTNHPQPVYDTADNNKLVAATDWLGRRFTVGDTVMYCISASRGSLMAIGKVVKMEIWKTGGWSALDYVRVQVLTMKTSGQWDNEVRTRAAWVNPMNITAIPEDWSIKSDSN